MTRAASDIYASQKYYIYQRLAMDGISSLLIAIDSAKLSFAVDFRIGPRKIPKVNPEKAAVVFRSGRCTFYVVIRAMICVVSGKAE